MVTSRQRTPDPGSPTGERPRTRRGLRERLPRTVPGLAQDGRQDGRQGERQDERQDGPREPPPARLPRLGRSRQSGPRVSIRPFRPGDEAGLADVCLRTAADGEDASDRHRHPALPAAVYALPYARFEPDLCLVVDDGTREGRVSGYVLGTSDTESFESWCERAWWPGLRRTYPLADMVEPGDRAMAELVHRPRRTPARITDRYPAHLHVDLLPHVQGGGWGRRLLEGFMAAAAGAGATAVHLGVSERNSRAIGFYGRLGFALVERTDGALLLGRPL